MGTNSVSRLKAAIGGALILLDSFALGGDFARQEWPAYHKNELESLWLEGGVGLGFKYNRLQPFGEAFVRDCSQFPNREAAQWVRLAYHDSATHNVNGDGLGGLDQSIRFELDRPENVGGSLGTTLLDLGDLPTMHVSVADTLALSVVHAVAICRGPLIPYRGGRIDATEAGPPGVPEPEGTLEEHTESFRKQGFTKTEMIELVACGHTMGSVHQSDFPNLGPFPQDDPTGRPAAPFDTTPHFDTAVVTEYLSGTTKNVLVVHPNATLTSDLRIFSSDGNKTMKALANPAVFQRRCRDVLEKMINTVPRTVKLGRPLAPIEVKVGQSFLTYNTGLGLHTDIRFLSDNPRRNVTLKWQSRNSNEVHSASPAYVSANETTLAKRLGHETMVHYWFEPSIDTTTSISKFWFEVDEGRGRKPDVYDNYGESYPIEQDAVVFAPELSSSIIQGFQHVGWRLVVAIRNTQGPIGDVKARFRFFSLLGDRPDLDENRVMTVDSTIPAVEGFNFYSVVIEFGTDTFGRQHATRAFFDVTAVVGGKTVREENLSTFYMVPPFGL